MRSPELAASIMQDMGFSVDDGLSDEQALSILESRYQGNEQTFPLEGFSRAGQLVLSDHLSGTQLTLLFQEGKKSSILLDESPIYVLSPSEVGQIWTALSTIDLTALHQEWLSIEKLSPVLPEATAEQVDLFWMLFPGLFYFFQNAAEGSNCILRAAVK